MSDLLPAIAIGLAVALAALLGAAILLLQKLATRSEALARAEAEVERWRAAAAAAEPQAARAAVLDSELAALRSRFEERERASEDARAERERAHAEELKRLREAFDQLAAEALARAQRHFTEQAAETLKLHRSEAGRNLAEVIGPMQEQLKRYEAELKAIEGKREQAYGALAEQLQAVASGQAAVQVEAGRIVAALRSSAKASGAWGEAQLRNVLEMAGLREKIDFELQASTTDEAGQRRRPDARLRLPGGRELIIDSKVSLADYLAASDAADETSRTAALKRHALAVRAHAKALADKAYWQEFAASADFVVMFLPGENFLSAALEHDLDLLGWALDRRILLAGPTNLLAIARVVAMVWRQEKMADEARAIGQLGAELYASLATMTEHVARVGKNIGEAAGAYNDFIGSLETRVLSKARRFPELGVDPGRKPLAELQPVEKTIRLVQAPDMRRLEGGG